VRSTHFLLPLKKCLKVGAGCSVGDGAEDVLPGADLSLAEEEVCKDVVVLFPVKDGVAVLYVEMRQSLLIYSCINLAVLFCIMYQLTMVIIQNIFSTINSMSLCFRPKKVMKNSPSSSRMILPSPANSSISTWRLTYSDSDRYTKGTFPGKFPGIRVIDNEIKSSTVDD
jgi:hypothetical protein